MASLLKAGFDPNQPRDDGGRWTDAGGGANGSGNETAGKTRPVRVASATPETMSDATQLAMAPDRHWERHPNREFRQSIAEAERSAEHANHGYEQHNQNDNAVGRY